MQKQSKPVCGEDGYFSKAYGAVNLIHVEDNPTGYRKHHFEKKSCRVSELIAHSVNDLTTRA